MKYDNDKRSKSVEPLLKACSENNSTLAEDLLKKGVKPDTRTQYGVTALTIAVTNENFGMVKILLKNGAHPDFRGEHNGFSPLFLSYNNLEITEALIAAGANVNLKATERAITPLMNASGGHNHRVVKTLLNAGADVNAEEHQFGYTPLACAALSENPSIEIINLLIESGADTKRVIPVLKETIENILIARGLISRNTTLQIGK